MTVEEYCRVEVYDADVSDALSALRCVIATEVTSKEARLESGITKMYRELKASDPVKALTLLQSMENGLLKLKEKRMDLEKGAKVADEDVGADKALAMCEEWLKANGVKL